MKLTGKVARITNVRHYMGPAVTSASPARPITS